MSPEKVETREQTQEMKQEARQTAEQAREEAQSMVEAQKRRMSRMADEQKGRAVHKVSALAEALKASGERLRQNDESRMAEYVERASDSLNSYAQRLRDRDLQEMYREAKDMARRNPSLFLGGAFALGFALTRFLKSSEEEAGYRYQGGYGHRSRASERDLRGGYVGEPGGPDVGPEPSGAYAGAGSYGGPGYSGVDPTTRRPA